MFGIASITLVLLLPGFRVEGYVDYEDISEQDNDDYYVNYDAVDEDPIMTSDVASNNPDDDINNRIRRDQDDELVNTETLSPEDLADVKGALKNMLSRIGSENPFTRHPTAPSTTYLPTSTDPKTRPTASPHLTVSQSNELVQNPNIPKVGVSIFKIDDDNNFIPRGFPTRSSKAQLNFNQNYLDRQSTVKTTKYFVKNGSPKGITKELLRIGSENPFTPHSAAPYIAHLPTATELDTSSTTPSYSLPETSSQTEELALSSNGTEEDILTSIFKILHNDNLPTRSSKALFILKNNLQTLDSSEALRHERNSLRNHTSPMAAKTPQIDSAKLLEIIAELAKEFEANLTRQLNDTILQMSIPTCTTPTEPAHTTATDEYDANYTGAVIAKCFVCGLESRGVPRHAHCADAFAGDFLPVVPVDSSARRKVTGFRKYCKYANIRGYREARSRPHVVEGRWTGGCAVRWADLSGVYTQRTCRNRFAPTTGRHFASKRMAQLERALWDVQDGCIASPAASLTPLSRGVSLYARFHACVCSGSWCNAAPPAVPPAWPLLAAAVAVTLA